MKKLFALLVVFCCLGVAVDTIAKDDKKPAKEKKAKAPKEKKAEKKESVRG